jgi:hypothetical protein
MRAPPLAGAALPAHRPPVQDHEITRLDVDDTIANRLDRPGSLMTAQ